MKKIILILALLVAGFTTAAAQTQNVGSFKAQDKIGKAQVFMQTGNVDEALKLYDEAEAILKEEMAKAEAKGDNSKLAKLYLQVAELNNGKLNPIMQHVQKGEAFDTVHFCQYIDGAIQGYNNAAIYNTKPNAKGKVKTDKVVQMQAYLGVNGYLKHYYYCGAFIDGVGDKQKSVDYFTKFVDLPRTSPVFTEAQRDSIYKADAQTYAQARVNLALQNYFLKNWDAAIAAADEALKDTVDLSNLYTIKAQAYGEKKDSANWAKTFVEASRRTGDNGFFNTVVYNYMQNNKTAEAKALGEQLVAEAPNDKMSWNAKGSLEINVLKDYAAARQSFEKALAIDPNYEDALFNLASAYINDVYEQEHAGKLKNQAATDKLVREYYGKALPYLQRLKELTPNNARRWASPLQMVYSGLGMTAEAKEMDALLDAANQQQ